MSGIRHETVESFYEAEHDDILVATDAVGFVWLAWNAESGDWFAIRPLNEDDAVVASLGVGDPWTPVGPVNFEELDFPITVADARKALEVQA